MEPSVSCRMIKSAVIFFRRIKVASRVCRRRAARAGGRSDSPSKEERQRKVRLAATCAALQAARRDRAENFRGQHNITRAGRQSVPPEKSEALRLRQTQGLADRAATSRDGSPAQADSS